MYIMGLDLLMDKDGGRRRDGVIFDFYKCSFALKIN